MKKLLIILSILALSILNTYATGSSSESNGYNEPIKDSSLNFKATLDGDKVYTSWSQYTKDEGFVYYKVIRSQDNTNPVYPDNGYIYYTSDVKVTNYTDKAINGTSHYRVCAITSEKNRYCSNVIQIYKEKVEEVKIGGDKDEYGCYTSAGYSWCEVKSKCIRSWEEKCEKATYDNTDTTKKIQEYNLKQKAEKLVNTFLVKVEKLYTSTEKRIEVINKIIEKLNTLAESKPSQKQIIDFIVTKLKAKIDVYKGSDLGDIESIFSEIE